MNIYEIRDEMLKRRTRISDYKLRVVYYARVSTDKMDQRHSLEAQKSHFEDMMKHYPNWTFIRGYVDEGLTGTSVDKRDSFREMIRDAQKGNFDLICTKEVSRFARNTLDAISYARNLINYGVAIYFEFDNLCTADADCEVRLVQMASQAQEESRKTSERLKFGFCEAVKKGSVLGNNNIWGYCKDGGKLVIVPEEAEMVRKIYDMYVSESIGIRAIAKAVSEMGYRNSKENPFTFSTIKGIITNPKYKGFYCGNKTHTVDFLTRKKANVSQDEWVMFEDYEKVPPIVSADIWDRANEKFKARSESMKSEAGTSYHNKYLYSGKLVCKEHNVCYHHTTYKYKSGNKELWACREYGNGNKCRNPIVYTTEMDAVMKEIYGKIVCGKTAIINDLIELYKECGGTKAITDSRHRVQSDINGILAKKDKLFDLLMDDRITKDEFQQRNNDFNSKLEDLKSKLSELDDEERKSKDLKASIESLRASIESELDYTDELSKNVVDSLIEKIIVSKGAEDNRIDMKIFLKLLPDSLQSFSEEAQVLTFGEGEVLCTRGGNSRAVREYEVVFLYELCYRLG
ncbi:MAG: recombinase family protein [Clostridia bacterium]|nr:recombinase family protein [Clostridia bacterium]